MSNTVDIHTYLAQGSWSDERARTSLPSRAASCPVSLLHLPAMSAIARTGRLVLAAPLQPLPSHQREHRERGRGGGKVRRERRNVAHSCQRIFASAMSSSSSLGDSGLYLAIGPAGPVGNEGNAGKLLACMSIYLSSYLHAYPHAPDSHTSAYQPINEPSFHGNRAERS